MSKVERHARRGRRVDMWSGIDSAKRWGSKVYEVLKCGEREVGVGFTKAARCSRRSLQDCRSAHPDSDGESVIGWTLARVCDVPAFLHAWCNLTKAFLAPPLPERTPFRPSRSLLRMVQCWLLTCRRPLDCAPRMPAEGLDVVYFHQYRCEN